MNMCVPTVEARSRDMGAWCQERLAVAVRERTSLGSAALVDAGNPVNSGEGLTDVVHPVYVLAHHL